jgi:hypothetical protein
VFAQPVEFVLEPPVDREWRVAHRSTTSVMLAGDRRPRHRSVKERERLVIFSEEGNQRWSTGRLTRVAWSLNGVVKQPSDEALVGQPTAVAFDQRGLVVSMRGFDALAAHLQTVWGQTAPSAALLMEEYRNGWNGTYGTLWGVLSGRSASVGQSWRDDRALILVGVPTAAVPASGQWTLAVRETPAPAGRAYLRYEYTSGAVPLLSDDPIGAWVAAQLPEVRDAVWSTIDVKSRGDVLINPATLVDMTWTDVKEITLVAEDPSLPAVHLTVEFESRIE